MTRTVVIAFAALLTLGNCAGEPSPEPVDAPPRDRVVIGLIPEQNIFRQFDRYEPVADYIERRSGVEIELKILSRYGNLIDNFASSGLDGGFMGSFVLALAHERLGVEPLARPEGLDGTSTYYGLIFVRKDSGISLYRDLMDKRFVFVDRATTAGYLLPLKFFHDFGIRDYHSVFSASYFAGSHEDAILDVLDGRADVGAAKNTVFARMAREDPRVGTELVFLAKSPEVPENALGLRGDLDPEIRAKLAKALLDMHEDPVGERILHEFGARKFIETTMEDYAPVYEYATEVGLDLTTYDYVNR